MRYLVKGLEVYSEKGKIKNGCLIVNNGIIEQISNEITEQDMEIIDLSKYRIIPGLIDMHIHGANGFDAMDSSYESINEISKYLAKNGVTSFLPTTVTSDFENIKSAISNIDIAKKKGVEGARVLGSYIEGPYITEEYRGAHPIEFIRNINIDEINDMLRISNGSIKVMAIASEKEGSMDMIRLLKCKGVKVSIGHTNATYDVAKEAIRNGADIAVHIFNGMRGLHHREPGVVGACLIDDEVFTELICDTIHVHPEVMKLIIRCKGTDKVCLISDCMRAGGLADGEYQLGEMKVIVSNSIPRLDNGSLAGSTLKLLNGVKNMIDIVGIDPLEAFHMASLIPARALNMENDYGSIKAGKKADFVAIDDNYNVVMTFVDGRIVFSNQENLKNNIF